MSTRRQQLEQFKTVMAAIIQHLQAADTTGALYGFHEPLMRQANDLAGSLGWSGTDFANAPEGFRLPFWRRSNFWLRVGDAFGGGSWEGSILNDIPDELAPNLGGERIDKGWSYPDPARHDAFLREKKSCVLISVVPLLSTWITRADIEMSEEQSNQGKAARTGKGNRATSKRRSRIADNPKLTAKQKQAIELFGKTHSVVRVAQAMGIKHSTASDHIAKANRKLGITARARLSHKSQAIPRDRRQQGMIGVEDDHTDLDARIDAEMAAENPKLRR
jgi:DNA-binding CsgD family transcriptional regulator